MREERRKNALRLLSPLLLWSVIAAPVHAATVISVGDVDTIRVREAGQTITVRLACIDAPETAQRPYGLQSRSALSALVPAGSAVTLKVQTVDRYGRSVAELLNSRGNINQLMVGRGQAFAYRKYLKRCDQPAYLSLERQAQNAGLGVWSVGRTGITRPWKYRRSRSARSNSTGSSRRYRCKEIASWQRAQQLLAQGHTYLDGDRDGEACEALR